MGSSAEKSSAPTSTPATQAVEKPFFPKAGEGDFFKPAGSGAPAVQAKMTVNKPGDKFEQEADKMADKVMRMPDPAPATTSKEEKIQRAPDEKVQKRIDDRIMRAEMKEDKIQKAEMKEDKVQKAEAKEDKIQKAEMKEDKVQKVEAKEDKVQKKEEENVQRKSTDSSSSVGAGTQSAIQNRAASGQPLSPDVRSHMEPRFGADFSGVRVHNDSEAASLSSQLGARAFTYQNNVFFGQGQYQPGTSEGKQLLAHELTHTIQQGHAEVQRKAETSSASARQPDREQVQKAPAAGGGLAMVSSEVVDVSSNTFNPSQKVKEEIEAQGQKGLDVRVVVKGVTGEGRIKVRLDSQKTYDSIGKGSMPLLNEWTQQLGGMHLNFSIKNSQITGGYASMKPGGGDSNDWLQSLQKNAATLGGLGLKVGQLPTPVNKFDNGKLSLGVTGLKVEVGGFLNADFNLSLENASTPKIDASADVDVKGIAKGQLKMNNTDGKLVGEVSLSVDFKSFSGAAKVKYNADGTVDVGGKAAYNANKLSGQIEFVATDLESANKFAQEAVAAAGGKENVQNAAAPAPVPVPKQGSKKRALAATGQLSFNLTTWFAGQVTVVVDGKGDITVIGKIAPPAEIQLFAQKDWDKELIKFEAKAYYGIPLVGNLNLFANISLHALAKLGPAKIYNIEILGTYSTDPAIQKSIQISGSINISAYAGLRLRAEGGAGIEIIGHDLKFGVGLNADIGVKAYADARPTIGYRDPGEFYVSGTLDLIAQPMLGLGGDFFIELDSPWWSPAPDKKWTWPLFSKEWPLSDPIGLSASVKDYVLGSGKVPEIEMKKPEFDPSKFMTNMVDDKLPSKSGGKADGKGSFKEDGSVPKPEVKPKKPAPKQADAKGGKKGAKPGGGKSGKPDPAAAKGQDNSKALQTAIAQLKALSGKGPITEAALNAEIAKIKAAVKGVSVVVDKKGPKWTVTVMPPAVQKKKKGEPFMFEVVKGGGDADSKLKGAIAAAHDLIIKSEKEEEKVEAGIPAIVQQFGLKTLRPVKDHEGLWHMEAEINPKLQSTPEALFTKSQLKMLKKLGQDTARAIQEHKADGWPAEYRKDKRSFLKNENRVVVGKIVEVAGAHIVEQLAMEKGFSVLRNVNLQFLDGDGKRIGGEQHELDFVIVGNNRIEEIISAKINPGKVSVKGDQGKLALMRDIPLQLQQLREYAIKHFVKEGSIGKSVWNRVKDASVTFNDRGENMSMSLQNFRSKYLAKTAVEQLSVRSLSPSQDEGIKPPDIALKANTNELLDQLIKFIDASLK